MKHHIVFLNLETDTGSILCRLKNNRILKCETPNLHALEVIGYKTVNSIKIKALEDGQEISS